MKFKNIKVEINGDQPLVEVVMEFERLGYKKHHIEDNANIVLTKDIGTYSCYRFTVYDSFNMITLAELKEMK